MYKNEVQIPPLSMVDDAVCISECGYQTSMKRSFSLEALYSRKSMKENTVRISNFKIEFEEIEICEDFKFQI